MNQAGQDAVAEVLSMVSRIVHHERGVLYTLS